MATHESPLPSPPLLHTPACDIIYCMILHAHQPSMTAPPAGPPRTWSGNTNGSYSSAPPPLSSGGGQNGLHQQAYGAPPSFAPPMGPPSSANGYGPQSTGGGQGVYVGGESMPRAASAPMSMDGGGGGPGLASPMMGAPGQVREAFLRGK